MKKVVLIGVLLILSVYFVACGNVYENLVRKNMSDIRINYFVGQCDDYYVNLSCGYRENNFAYDGVSTNHIECGVLALGFFEAHNYFSISVNLCIDGESEELVMERSPYEDIYMVDIGRVVTSKNKVSINLKKQDKFAILNEISNEWNIGWEKAIKIGSTYFEKIIEPLYSNKSFNAEAYLKIVTNNEFDNIFWYFSIIDKHNNTYFCLIDVNTGDVSSN